MGVFKLKTLKIFIQKQQYLKKMKINKMGEE